MAAPASTEILDVNRRYHDVAAPEYDSKWGVDFGPVGRAQVLGKVEKLLGRDPGPFARSLEIGSGTGYFTLNLMQDGVIAAGVCTRRLARHARRAARQRRAARPRRRDGRLRRRRAAVRGRELRPRARPRGAAPPARAGARRSRSCCACCAPAACCCSPASRRATATASRRLPKRAGLAVAPLWRRRSVRARPRPATAAAPDDHALESLVDVHAFAPAELERHATAAGFADVRVRGEELLANMFGWFNRTVEASAVHERHPARLVPLRLPRLHPAAEARHRGARAAPPGGGLLQPDAHGAQAGGATSPVSRAWSRSRPGSPGASRSDARITRIASELLPCLAR